MNKLRLEHAIKKMEIFGDNKTSLILIKDPESQNRTKSIDIMHYHLQRLVKKVKLKIE